MPRPPYLRDLASSDFCLFLIVKEKLERIQVADEDQFWMPVSYFADIDQEELNGVFQA
jgi:hypothetical protein